jgi:hypothetical protein
MVQGLVMAHPFLVIYYIIIIVYSVAAAIVVDSVPLGLP